MVDACACHGPGWCGCFMASAAFDDVAFDDVPAAGPGMVAVETSPALEMASRNRRGDRCGCVGFRVAASVSRVHMMEETLVDRLRTMLWSQPHRLMARGCT